MGLCVAFCTLPYACAIARLSECMTIFYRHVKDEIQEYSNFFHQTSYYI